MTTHGFLTRDTRYSALEPKDVQYFKTVLKTPDTVLTEKSAVEKYNEEYTKKYNGLSQCVVRPKSVEEISQILAYCNKRKLAVVPQGGRTSLVAGATSCFDEIVINMERMNKIYDLSPYTGILKCQAGVILEEAEKYCGEKGYIFPLDLGAKGSCQIGGNLGANAGGLHFLKYGSLHGNCIGMTAVLANGQILDTLHSHRKDNTGYDLKQLFIGAEGTLGIITDAAILCYPKPASSSLSFLGIKSFDNIKSILMSAKKKFGESLSAIEMMDDQSYELIQKHIPSTRVPFENDRYPFYMVIETHHNGTQAESDDRLMSFIDSISDHIENGIISRDETQAKQIWTTREKIADAFVKEGVTFKYDVSLDTNLFYELVPILRQRVGSDAVVGGYGHVGDGNIHINVTVPGYTDTPRIKKVHDLLEPYVLEEVAKRNGSISAEHGVGFAKAQYLMLSKSDACIDTMLAIKSVLDPNGIMCPYKVFPHGRKIVWKSA